MAWTEQCKVAFRVGVKAKIHNKGLKLKDALQELKEESDIPKKTLERWYYEKDLKTEDSKAANGNNEENKDKRDVAVCPKCGKPSRIVEQRNGKKYVQKLCISCMNEKSVATMKSQLAMLNGKIKKFQEKLLKVRDSPNKWSGSRGFTQRNCQEIINTLTETLKIWEEVK